MDEEKEEKYRRAIQLLVDNTYGPIGNLKEWLDLIDLLNELEIDM